jgi:TPR repeat protein
MSCLVQQSGRYRARAAVQGRQMDALYKYALALAVALGAGVYAFGPLKPEGNVRVRANPEAAALPADLAALASAEEELDYRTAQRVTSLEGWRAFLAAHENSPFARTAKAEIKRLLIADLASTSAELSNGDVAPVAAQAILSDLPNGTPRGAKSASETAPQTPSPSGTDVTPVQFASGAPPALKASSETASQTPSPSGTDVTPAQFASGAPPAPKASSETASQTPSPSGTDMTSAHFSAPHDAKAAETASRTPNPSGTDVAPAQLASGAPPDRKAATETTSQTPNPPARNVASPEPPQSMPPDARAISQAADAVIAGGYEDGVAAYKRGDFAAAKRLWLQSGEKGDAKAQFGLALIYFLGQGVNVNMAAALDWCQKAADQGLAAAQYELGQIYQHPWLPELHDFAEAARWYREAAGQGYVKAQDELGGMYEFGLGVPRDYALAEKWFEKAGDWVSIAKMYDSVAENPRFALGWYYKLAERGDKYARFRLGEMYRDGEGVSQDYAFAHLWFNLAAGSGYSYASMARDELARKMTPYQVAKAQQLEREWQPKK